MRNGSALKAGDRVGAAPECDNGFATIAIVDDVTESYVKLCWGHRQSRGDIILKTSPLWQLLELVE